MGESTLFSMIMHTTLNSIGLILNSTLIYMIAFKTPKVIRRYSLLILNFALTDLGSSIFDLFVEVRIIPAGTSLAYISSGVCTEFGPFACYVGYTLLLHCYAHSLWSLLLSFSYRYYILFHPAPSTRTIIFLFICISPTTLLQTISFLWAYDPVPLVEQRLHEIFPDYDYTNQTVYGTLNIFQFSALYTIFHMTLPITPVYTIILILRHKIIKKLCENANEMTKETRQLHSQLLRALTYQSIIPAFYFCAAVSFGIGQTGIYNSPILEYCVFILLIFIPVLSPLTSLYFVGPYRLVCKRWLANLTCGYRLVQYKVEGSQSNNMVSHSEGNANSKITLPI